MQRCKIPCLVKERETDSSGQHPQHGPASTYTGFQPVTAHNVTHAGPEDSACIAWSHDSPSTEQSKIKMQCNAESLRFHARGKANGGLAMAWEGVWGCSYRLPHL